MDSKAVISIIVPIYKAQAYLSRCVESILNQTYSNLEVILVDDGSPDNCPILCDEYAKNDSRVKVIHKENGGVSSARNAGLDAVTGDYVMFVDSDDYILPDYCEILIKTANENGSDMVCSDLTMIFEDGINRQNSISGEINKDYELENFDDILGECANYKSFTVIVWAKIFKKAVVEDIRFDSNLKFGEDTKFTRDALYNCRKVNLIANKGYCYYRNSSSATISNKGEKFHFDHIIVAFELFNKCKQLKSSHISNAAIYCHKVVVGAYMMMCDVSCDSENYKKNLNFIDKYAKEVLSFKPDVGFSQKIIMLMCYYCFPLARKAKRLVSKLH